MSKASINNPKSLQQDEETYEPIDFELPLAAPKQKRQNQKSSPRKKVSNSPPAPNFKASKPTTATKATKKQIASGGRRILEQQELEKPTEAKTYRKSNLDAFKYKGPIVRSTGYGHLSPLLSTNKRTLEDPKQNPPPKKTRLAKPDSDNEDFFDDLDSQELIELEKATRKLSTEERCRGVSFAEPQDKLPTPKQGRPSTTRTRTVTTDYFSGDAEDYSLFNFEELPEEQLYHGGEDGASISTNVQTDVPQTTKIANPSIISSSKARTRTGWASPVRGITYEDLILPTLDLHPHLHTHAHAHPHIHTSSPPYTPNASENPNYDYRIGACFSEDYGVCTKVTPPDEYNALISAAEDWNNASDTLKDGPRSYSSSKFFTAYAFTEPTTIEKATPFKSQSSFTPVSSIDIYAFSNPTRPTTSTQYRGKKRKPLLQQVGSSSDVHNPVHIQCTATSSPKPPITEYVTKKPKYSEFRPRAVLSDSETGERLNRYINPHEAEEKAKEAAEKKKEAERLKPFVRPRFPGCVKDRSPVEGLRGNEAVKVCFRIGEVVRLINGVGLDGGKGWGGYIELYARVEDSFRLTTSDRQIFRFHDLFHSNPPYLTGYYDHHTQAEQWNVDSAAFLQESHTHAHPEKRIARVVGKGRKIEGGIGHDKKRKPAEYVLDVARIWPATEEDVVWARKVICGVEK